MENQLSLKDILDLEIDADGLRLDMKLTNEVYADLMEKHHIVSRETFDTLVELRWRAYCRDN